ncbi:MAG: hypothetical protein HKN25_10200 [Pyrinomonadaceae bacterium]|nr:hypothetical protein [Pyrinomonadaceae bacterium]
MKKRFIDIFYGKSSLGSGVLALMIISLIVLGCTCNEKDGFSFGKNDSDTADTGNTSTVEEEEKEPEELSRDVKASRSAPSEEDLQRLVKTTMLDFSQAIKDEDFSEFYKHISKFWQKQIKADKFDQVFKAFMVANWDGSSIRTMKADITSGPTVRASRLTKRLEVKGAYDTSPRSTKFDLGYIEEDGLWKLYKINVSTK